MKWNEVKWNKPALPRVHGGGDAMDLVRWEQKFPVWGSADTFSCFHPLAGKPHLQEHLDAAIHLGDSETVKSSNALAVNITHGEVYLKQVSFNAPKLCRNLF